MGSVFPNGSAIQLDKQPETWYNGTNNEERKHMNSQGDPQIRKIGADYYFKAEDLLLIFDYFADEALETLSEQDDDEVTEFDLGMFEGAAEVLDDLAKSLKLMVTEKRLNKVKTLEDFTTEFPETTFQRNRKLETK
jgi:hypothetical protein